MQVDWTKMQQHAQPVTCLCMLVQYFSSHLPFTWSNFTCTLVQWAIEVPIQVE